MVSLAVVNFKSKIVFIFSLSVRLRHQLNPLQYRANPMPARHNRNGLKRFSKANSSANGQKEKL
jgi:hypothetical protein